MTSSDSFELLPGPDWAALRSRWPNVDASRFVSAAGSRWHVQVAGSGPVLLLLHGAGGSSHSWAGVMDALRDSFTVVAPDLPGHGFTEAPSPDRLAPDPIAQDLDLLMRQLRLEPRMVAGHSAGAAIAARFVFEYAQRCECVACIAPAFESLPFLGGPLGPLIDPFRGVLRATALTGRFTARFVASLAASDLLERILRTSGSELPASSVQRYRDLLSSPGHAGAMLTLAANWKTGSLIEDMRGFAENMLLLAADRDRWIPVDGLHRVAQRIGAPLDVLRTTGHLAPEEQPETVAARLRLFARLHGVAGAT
jgi:magnesium chelatase accessory protein